VTYSTLILRDRVAKRGSIKQTPTLSRHVSLYDFAEDLGRFSVRERVSLNMDFVHHSCATFREMGLGSQMCLIMLN
jgi:hypothetical protein